MELQIPMAEPVVVERQEPLMASLVNYLFLYHIVPIDTPVHKQQPEEHGMRRSIDAVTDDLWLIKVDGVHLNLTKDDQRRLKGSLDNGHNSFPA